MKPRRLKDHKVPDGIFDDGIDDPLRTKKQKEKLTFSDLKSATKQENRLQKKRGGTVSKRIMENQNFSASSSSLLEYDDDNEQLSKQQWEKEAQKRKKNNRVVAPKEPQKNAGWWFIFFTFLCVGAFASTVAGFSLFGGVTPLGFLTGAALTLTVGIFFTVLTTQRHKNENNELDKESNPHYGRMSAARIFFTLMTLTFLLAAFCTVGFMVELSLAPLIVVLTVGTVLSIGIGLATVNLDEDNKHLKNPAAFWWDTVKWPAVFLCGACVLSLVALSFTLTFASGAIFFGLTAAVVGLLAGQFIAMQHWHKGSNQEKAGLRRAMRVGVFGLIFVGLVFFGIGLGAIGLIPVVSAAQGALILGFSAAALAVGICYGFGKHKFGGSFWDEVSSVDNKAVPLFESDPPANTISDSPNTNNNHTPSNARSAPPSSIPRNTNDDDDEEHKEGNQTEEKIVTPV